MHASANTRDFLVRNNMGPAAIMNALSTQVLYQLLRSYLKSTVLWDVVMCSLVGVTDVSEKHNASILRAEGYAEQASSQLTSTRLYGATSQKNVVFLVTAVRTSNQNS